MTILIRKVSEPYGWLGNMSPHEIEWNNKLYRTSEALFQSMRFDDEEVIEQIRSQRSPMSAKMIAKKHRSSMIVEPMSNDDLANMRLCLQLKIQQHSDLKNLLLATGDQLIIEDCTKRARGSGLFWGAAFDGNTWVGENHLGRLWIELREQMGTSVQHPLEQHRSVQILQWSQTMPRTPMITDEEREQLQPLLSLIPDPDRLYACTMAGEFFDCSDHALMAYQIWRRMGRNQESTGAAWRRLMQSNCPTEDVMALVAFHVFNEMNTD